MIESVYVILALLVLVVGTLLALINRYRRCPSDKIWLSMVDESLNRRQSVCMVVVPSCGLS